MNLKFELLFGNCFCISTHCFYISGIIFCQKVSLYKIVFLFFVDSLRHQEEVWVFSPPFSLERVPPNFLRIKVQWITWPWPLFLSIFIRTGLWHTSWTLEILKNGIIVCFADCVFYVWISVLLIRILVLKVIISLSNLMHR